MSFKKKFTAVLHSCRGVPINTPNMVEYGANREKAHELSNLIYDSWIAGELSFKPLGCTSDFLVRFGTMEVVISQWFQILSWKHPGQSWTAGDYWDAKNTLFYLNNRASYALNTLIKQYRDKAHGNGFFDYSKKQ